MGDFNIGPHKPSLWKLVLEQMDEHSLTRVGDLDVTFYVKGKLSKLDHVFMSDHEQWKQVVVFMRMNITDTVMLESIWADCTTIMY